MLPNYNLVEIGGEASVYARAFGRKMIGLIAESNSKNEKLYRTLEDGTVLVAIRAHKQYRLTIATPVRATPETPVVEATLWIPRGFVLYPVSSESVNGWGAPVVRAGTPDPLNADSLAPGLDVARWTSGGYLGEALLTQQLGNGYPKPQFEITPAFFSTDESPTMESSDGGATFVASKKPYPVPKQQADWVAYRIEFTDFSTAGGEGDSGSRQFAFRTALTGTTFLPPIRGYYDDAARLARYAVSTDFSGLRLDDGTLSKAPVGYAKAPERLDKDGAADAVAHDSVSLATNAIAAADDAASGAHLTDSTFTPSRTSVSIGLRNGMTAFAATEHAQWIAYGNRYWIGNDTALPVVTWDGFPSWNWPEYLVLGLSSGTNFVDLNYYTAPVRGQNRPLFSKRVCANGRELGTLPDYVLSAGVQTSTDSSTGVVTDHLIVLTWRLSDQGISPSTPSILPGDNISYNNVLRVYFADIPRRNGLALLPDHALIGLYDATANPDGWHYAGTVALYPNSEFDTAEYIGLLQPPQFKGDGTAAVFIVSAQPQFGGTLWARYAQEISFSSIADGTVAYSVQPGVGHMLDGAVYATPTFDSNGYGPLAIDYASDGFVTVYGASVTVPKDVGGYISGSGLDDVVRWSRGSNVGSPNYGEGDVLMLKHTTYGFYGYCVFVLDPYMGATVALGQKPISLGGGSFEVGSFNVVTAINGVVSPGATYSAPSGLGIGGPLDFLYNYADAAVVSFARDRGANYVLGYELAPTEFLGAQYTSNLGDLAALTQTPGDSPRFYPVGVV